MKKSDECRFDEPAGGRIVLELDGATAHALIRDLSVLGVAASQHAFREHHGKGRAEIVRAACRVMAFCSDLEGRR